MSDVPLPVAESPPHTATPPPTPQSPASEPELTDLAEALFEEQIDHVVLDARSPPLADEVKVTEGQDGSQSSLSEESEGSNELEDGAMLHMFTPLVTCSRCGRQWDGNAQCYPCIESDEEEAAEE